MDEVGKIEPIKKIAEEVAEPIQAAKETEEKEPRVFLWPLSIILFIGVAALAISQKDHLKSLGVLIGVIVLLYALSIPRFFKLAKAGYKALALKSLVGAFVPMLLALNTFVYKFATSDFCKTYLNAAKEGGEIFKGILLHVSPEYGNLIYIGILGSIVLGVNMMVIKKFVGFCKFAMKLTT